MPLIPLREILRMDNCVYRNIICISILEKIFSLKYDRYANMNKYVVVMNIHSLHEYGNAVENMSSILFRILENKISA